MHTHSIRRELGHVIGEDAVHGNVRVDRDNDAHSQVRDLRQCGTLHRMKQQTSGAQQVHD